MGARAMTAKERSNFKSMFNIPTKSVKTKDIKGKPAVAVVVKKDPKYKQKIQRNLFNLYRNTFAALKYTLSFTVTIPSGTVADAIYDKFNAAGSAMKWRLNSISRPLVGQAAGNVCPQGLNSSQTNFSKYKVLSTKWRVKAFDPEGEDLRLVTFTTASSDGQVLSGTIMNQMLMKDGTKFANVSLSGAQVGTCKGYTKIRGIEGLNKVQFAANESSYVGLPTQDVVAAIAAEANMKNPLLHIGLSPCYTLTADATVKIELELIYYTYFYNRNTIPMSVSY